MKSKSLKLSIIFSSLFLSLFFSLNQALAVNDCAWDPEKSWQGECMSYCTEGEEIEDPAGTAANCKDNAFFDTCCVPDPNANDGTICFGENGEEGVCQIDCTSWNPVGGVDYYDVGGNDCENNSLQKTCCSDKNPGDNLGSELTGYCTNGNESGACVSGMGAMFSSCPEGYHSIENAEGCSMGVDCCASGEGNPGNPGDGTTPPIIDENTFAEFGLPDPGKDGGNGVQKILVGLLNWLLIVFLIISLIAFVLTGLMYLFAVGNSRSDWVDKAKKYFVDALIAVFVTGSALIIINVVNDFLNGNL